MHVFISHNHRDKPIVTPLAAQLRMAGADVWLDSWEIRPGDSIIGKVSQALGIVDTVIVVWSTNTQTSRWVDREWETALGRSLAGDSVRVIPIALDDTPIPTLLQPVMRVDATDGDTDRVAREVLGLNSQAELLKAMQQTLEASRIEYEFFPGYGPVVGCPKCGAPVSELRPTTFIDHYRDDVYAGVECTACGWGDGGEL